MLQFQIKRRDVHTIVLGSGAAGLNAALQLHRHGVNDLLILTDSLKSGTSINTGSDKQTYYKLNIYGNANDSPRKMAETLFSGGATDGDTALCEAALSLRGFYNLLEIGVPFPQDAYGQYPGYKTDHDPLQRATSIGPYTSREVCRCLIAEIRRRQIEVQEERIAVKLFVLEENGVKRIGGVYCINTTLPLEQCIELYICENLVFAVGGPGGLYQTSVYPTQHFGGIGLALEAGAIAQNLAESQFGLASVKFRWNVSGTYMQVLPRIYSRDAKGNGEPIDFLAPYYDALETLLEATFLKGYQWPFDARKIHGSSLIDLLVYRETVEKGRQVFLDYRDNPPGLDFGHLPEEVHQYLDRSDALFGKPIDRLAKMNPQAIELYRANGINLASEPLEIAFCAQHNNGGLGVNRWWESANVKHLFPVGEVAGTHGVTRPGGSALNAGQVGGFRLAGYIAGRYADWTLDRHAAALAAYEMQPELETAAIFDWQNVRSEIRKRMSRDAAGIVDATKIIQAAKDAEKLLHDLQEHKETPSDPKQFAESIRTRQLCLTHWFYLNAVAFSSQSTGSRGSRILLSEADESIHSKLSEHMTPEDMTWRNSIAEIVLDANGNIQQQWRQCRPVPDCDAWFETAWAEYREGRHLL